MRKTKHLPQVLEGAFHVPTSITLADGRRVPVEALAFSDPKASAVYQAGRIFNKEGAAGLVKNYDGKAKPAMYVARFRQFYQAAVRGIPFESIRQVSDSKRGLSLAAQKAAYAAGEVAEKPDAHGRDTQGRRDGGIKPMAEVGLPSQKNRAQPEAILGTNEDKSTHDMPTRIFQYTDLLTDAPAGSREAYLRTVGSEPEITGDLLRVTNDIGGELTGLEFRLKPPESYMRKIHADMREKRLSEESAVNNTYDIIRYTSVSGPKTLVDVYNETVAKLEAMGYSLVRVKNTWTNPNAPYKGINAVFSSICRSQV